MAEQNEMTLIEAIRKRPAMYIGSTYIKGFNLLLKEIVKGIFGATKADYFSFELLGQLKGKFIFRNLQTAIPDNAAQEIWKRDGEFVRGFELVALNALSKRFEFRVFDNKNNELLVQNFEKGELKQGEIKNKQYEAHGFEAVFDLDDSIFEISESLNANFYLDRIRDFAYLYKGKTFKIIYPTAGVISQAVFNFKDGLKEKIEVEKLKGHVGTFLDFYVEKEFGNFTFETAFAFRESTVDESFLKSYVNDDYTHEHGSHVDGLIKGLISAAKKILRENDLTKEYQITKKGIKQILIAVVRVKMEQPYFEGSVKNKIVNPEIVQPIANYVESLITKKIKDDPKLGEELVHTHLFWRGIE